MRLKAQGAARQAFEKPSIGGCDDASFGALSRWLRQAV